MSYEVISLNNFPREFFKEFPGPNRASPGRAIPGPAGLSGLREEREAGWALSFEAPWPDIAP